MNSSNIGQENETKGNDDDGMLGNVNNDNNMNVVDQYKFKFNYK